MTCFKGLLRGRRQILRFIVAGAINTLFGFAVYSAAVLAGLPVWSALLVGNVAGVGFNFVTIGGYVFGVLGRLPQIGDRVPAGGAIFTVREMEGRKIDTLAIDLHSLGDRRANERDPQSGDKAESPR